MPLDAATVLALAAVCAPQVAAPTLLAVTRVESALEPLAIGRNDPGPKPPRAQTRAEAVRTAEALLARGANLDLGLAQINSRNLAPLGLSVSEAFEPCANLRAAADVLTAGYRRASPLGDQQSRLRSALSVYNTGHPQRGFLNGYVAKVVAAAGIREPARPAPRASTLGPSAGAAWRAVETAPAVAQSFVLSFNPGDRP